MRFPATILAFALFAMGCGDKDANGAARNAPPSTTVAAGHPYAGFWKHGQCDHNFGLAIEPAGPGLYSVSFCGPGGCFEPGTYRPNTPIVGDRAYRPIDENTLDIGGGDGRFRRYSRCPSGPGKAAGTQLPDRDALIQSVLVQFWGRARNVRGEPIQPASEQERVTVPVGKAVAYRALDAGEVSGLAEWCGLDWEPHYLALTRAARAQGMSDTQVAFIGVLHGRAQGGLLRGKAGMACSADERTRATSRLLESGKIGIPAPQ